jgi:hypothetical protein
MGRPARKLEARESVESRIINAVKYAFGSPEVTIDELNGTLSIHLGVLDGDEVRLLLPIRIEVVPLVTLHDDEDA